MWISNTPLGAVNSKNLENRENTSKKGRMDSHDAQYHRAPKAHFF